jgi:DNA-binding NtrC family response regulator
VEKKEFRQDLYFRLNVVPIMVPPLRDRAEDISFLAEQFMHRMARKHGVRVTGISQACHAALKAHSWPGNVRELQNVIERAVILASDGEELQPHHLGLMPSTTQSLASSVNSGAAFGVGGEEVTPLAEIEKRQILHAVERCGGNRTQAAKKLGISIRTLRNKLHEYGVGTKEDAAAEEEEKAAV